MQKLGPINQVFEFENFHTDLVRFWWPWSKSEVFHGGPYFRLTSRISGQKRTHLWWSYKILHTIADRLFQLLAFLNKLIGVLGFLSFFFFFQGNHACNVEASKIQVHIPCCHLICIHPNNSIGCCGILGLWGPTPRPFQCLFAPSPNWIPWCCCDPNAHPPGLYILSPIAQFLLPIQFNILLKLVIYILLSCVLQFITFGFACTPLYFVWEKVVGVHDTKSICLRALARLPVVIPIWFLAIIFPFFGPINSAVGALLVSFTVYIIPALAHMLTYRKASARKVNGPIFSPPLIFTFTGIIYYPHSPRLLSGP